MGRPAGRRSDDYDDKRRALATAVYEALIEDATITWSAMADKAGVSRPTLTHYFGDRHGAVRAALTAAASTGRKFLGHIVSMPTESPEETLTTLLVLIVRAWRDRGVGRLHDVGIQTGLADPASASTYLNEIMDPLAEAVQHLLERMQREGRIHHPAPRQASLQLLGPIVLALLHQNGLRGRHTAPLDEEALARETARGFLMAYGTD